MNEIGWKTRPWGDYNTIIHEDKHFVRYLYFKPGEELSLSRHELRDEMWIIIKGYVIITIDSQEYVLFPGDDIIVRKGQEHHIYNPSDNNELQILEIAWGEKVCDSDIIRISDKYGR